MYYDPQRAIGEVERLGSGKVFAMTYWDLMTGYIHNAMHVMENQGAFAVDEFVDDPSQACGWILPPPGNLEPRSAG